MFPNTYRAMQINADGLFEMSDRAVPELAAKQVLLAVEACGVCGADLADIAKNHGTGRVVGHEIVGRIIRTGANVAARWQTGQRVGVGRLGGHCYECDFCRQGDFVHCEKQSYVGASRDGGFAELMVADESGLTAVPDELDTLEAAPLLCAGLATFNALRKSGAQAGDTVAVLGMGGLGHLAVQYARKTGLRVIAVGRKDLAAEAAALGAHHYINSAKQEAGAALAALGGADLIVSTVNSAEPLAELAKGLNTNGKIIMLGASGAAMEIPSNRIVGKAQTLTGAITGTPYDAERTLAFSAMADVKPHIEVYPLAEAQAAVERLRSGQARFRVVLQVDNRFLE